MFIHPLLDILAIMNNAAINIACVFVLLYHIHNASFFTKGLAQGWVIFPRAYSESYRSEIQTHFQLPVAVFLSPDYH